MPVQLYECELNMKQGLASGMQSMIRSVSLTPPKAL